MWFGSLRARGRPGLGKCEGWEYWGGWGGERVLKKKSRAALIEAVLGRAGAGRCRANFFRILIISRPKTLYSGDFFRFDFVVASR